MIRNWEKATYVQNITNVSNRFPRSWKWFSITVSRKGEQGRNHASARMIQAKAANNCPAKRMTPKIVENHAASIDMIQSTKANVAVRGTMTIAGPLNARNWTVGVTAADLS